MPEITPDIVARIARLANLNLTQEEAARYAQQLEKIVDYVHALNRVDTRDVPETAHALTLTNVWREDRVKPGLDRAEALSQAPEAQDGGFRVPRILD